MLGMRKVVPDLEVSPGKFPIIPAKEQYAIGSGVHGVESSRAWDDSGNVNAKNSA